MGSDATDATSSEVCNRRTPIPELLLNGSASPSYSETIEDSDVKDIFPSMGSV